MKFPARPGAPPDSRPAEMDGRDWDPMVCVALVSLTPLLALAQAPRGYDRFPAIHGDTVVFTAEGFRRLGLGKVIGMRTWGGEIWLWSSNFLVDKGIATAAETGVYGPEGEWLIEGRGVQPDIVVDNLPAATFRGGDAQLDAAVRYLQGQIRDHPAPVPPPPAYPDKASKPGRR